MDFYSRDYARQLDAEDPLKDFRKQFIITDPNLIYLDGNSLGILPAATAGHMQDVVSREWGQGLISSWNTDWYERPGRVAAKIARLTGAQPDEILVADSTSVNLFKLAYAALHLQKGRRYIVSDDLNFPSDLYLFQGLIKMFNNHHELRLASSKDGIGVEMHQLEELLGDDTGLLSLSHVVFKSAFMYDMKAVTALAHQKGAIVLWDLSHATGAVPIDLNGSGADMAVGCTYKYLNGGPGSPAFLYVRKDLQHRIISPIQGWFGQHNPFAFDLDYRPAEGINRFFAGTPSILSLSALDPSLDILLAAGIDRIRGKSVKQCNYFLKLFHHFLEPIGFTLGSPEEEASRGSHISLRHPEAYRICKALIEPAGPFRIIPDFREPDNIRIGIAPLYTQFDDLFIAVQQMETIVSQHLYKSFSNQRDNIT